MQIMKISIIFLKVVVILIGIGTFIIMLWEPHIEGRNTHSTLFEIYFQDPFLAFAYIASTPYFVALIQVFKFLEYVKQNQVFSLKAVKTIRIIKYCAISIIGFTAIGEIFIMLSNSDDPAGGVFIGFLIAFGSIVIATFAIISEKVLQNAVDIKSKNDLIV